MKKYKTAQEEFWAGNFGTEYIGRNKSGDYLASNLNFFSKTLTRAGRPESIIEFGANIGMNLKAIRSLFPHALLGGIEINDDAFKILSAEFEGGELFHGSIFDYPVKKQYEIALIKGVLIHINPEMLERVYEKLYSVSSKFILISEYYNPTPVSINYRGNKDRLFKRDFAGEMLDMYPDLELVDYGFCYKRDPSFPQDDTTWFLLRK